MIASSQSFSMIQRRISLSPEPAPPVKSGEPREDDRESRAVLLLGRSHRLELVDHVLEKEERAVVDPGQPGPEPPVEAALVVLALDLLLLLLPVDAERWVREEVVVALAGELVVGEAVSVLDVLASAIVVDLLHQHVGCGRGEGALVVILPVDVEPSGGVVFAKVVLRLGEHASRAAGRVEELPYRARRCQELVVVDEEDAHHQADHFAGREVVAGGLVRELVEAPDEVLEDQPHLLVRDRARVQIDLCELRHDEEEDVRLAHLLDLGLELEVVEDAAHVGREPLDVAQQVLLDVVRVTLELREVEGRVVVEALARDLVEHSVQGLALVTVPYLLIPLDHGGLGRRQDAVEAPKDGQGQHDPLVLRRAIGAAEEVGYLPDEVREVVVVGHGIGPSPGSSGCSGKGSRPRHSGRLVEAMHPPSSSASRRRSAKRRANWIAVRGREESSTANAPSKN